LIGFISLVVFPPALYISLYISPSLYNQRIVEHRCEGGAVERQN